MGPGLLLLTTESPKSEMGTYAYMHREAACTHGNTQSTKTQIDRSLSLSVSLLHIAERDKQIHICFLIRADEETLTFISKLNSPQQRLT